MKTQKVKQQLEPLVTKNMTIGDVVSKYPALAEILMDNGVHCIGCGGAFMETIEQGFKSHGMSDEEVNRIVQEMNESLEEQGVQEEPTAEGVTITKKAAKKLKELLHEKKKETWGLRVEVTPGGCAGYSYGLDFEKKETKEDVVIEQEGVKLFIDQESYPMVKGATIDYVDALQGAGFKISNPNAHKTCGCGQSFG
ncbi:iron-sulfur cluster assembly accessory protein [Candidatus Woesearchaeota archaeon]|nr:iron-sulfur cluster assembly accessory protein [Candidatus Woesearchaeota archaeon]